MRTVESDDKEWLLQCTKNSSKKKRSKNSEENGQNDCIVLEREVRKLNRIIFDC
jgi:hypothetical protein